MKKTTLRILALITVICMALPLFGCLVKDENPSEPTGTKSPSSDGVKAPDGLATVTSAPDDPNGEAHDLSDVAIELGPVQISVDEFKDTFDQYVNYFSYGYSLDEEMLDEFLQMAEEGLIEYYMPKWKAEQLGIVLSEEQEAECARLAHETIEDERDYYLCLYGGADESVESAAELTEEQLASALDAINEELYEMFGDGFDFDAYLDMRYTNELDTQRINMLSELLRDDFAASRTADQSKIDELYETRLAAQKERFDADPAFYLTCQNGDDVESVYKPCLYVPAESARLEVIRVHTAEPDETLSEKLSALKALEAEYGALLLNGENEERQAEIVTEYAALKEEVETAEAALRKAAQNRIDAAYADLLGGMSFEDAMNTWNEPDENGSAQLAIVVLLDGNEPNHPELAEAAAALTVGAYSQTIRIGDEYCIVRLVEKLPKGVADRASVEGALIEAIRTDAESGELWEQQYDAWITEAKEAAVCRREAYSWVVDEYLSDY